MPSSLSQQPSDMDDMYTIRGGRVRAGTVLQALSAVNTTIALDINEQPVKAQGAKDFLPVISPKFLAELGLKKDATELIKAVGDLSLVAFFVEVGKYTIKVK
eukprot:scaffold267166_cov159-Cyclotella_meneghiniana.AAC.1